MEKARWHLYDRSNRSIFEHLCLVRRIPAELVTPSFTEHLHDPGLLPDIKEARALVVAAVKHNDRAVIFGDYDADGTPASAILSLAFDRIGLQHSVVLPTRETGYGLRLEDIPSFAKQAKLLVTVDTGITAVTEVALAKKLGMKVIILDHHLPKKELPMADAVVDPFIERSRYPFNELCGAALAYKLVLALRADFPTQLTEGFCKWLIEIVAIATVADMMPLTGENRVLVHFGLQTLAKTRRPGLIALMNVAGINPEALSASTLGFAIGPRFNASGRLADNRPVFELLKTTSMDEAKALAEGLERANRQRQDLVADVLAEATEQLWRQNNPSDRLIILRGENWPSGVLGLVAGKIVGQTGRPTIVLTKTKDGYSGSARSIENFSMISALEQTGKHLLRFGGHRLAAGLAVPAKRFDKFVDTIKSHANELLSEEDLRSVVEIDAELAHKEVRPETVREIGRLAPFGHKNPQPLFLLKDIDLSRPAVMGAAKNHLKWRVELAMHSFDLVGFGLAERFFAEPAMRSDIVGGLELNHWNGASRLQIKLKDYRPTGQAIDKHLTI
ncbi:MAG: single-stranded-DNA-specific exonuclease RecJ [Patescibacteria group bacterium]